MLICKISIIIIVLICQKLGLFRSVQKQIKLPSPYPYEIFTFETDLQECQFKHSFQNSLNPVCHCGCYAESTSNF